MAINPHHVSDVHGASSPRKLGNCHHRKVRSLSILMAF
jgi:hypothetical protein